MRCSLTRAYGRRCLSKKEVTLDLLNGADFILHDISSPWNGKPATFTELIRGGYDTAQVRYGRNNLKVMVVDLRELNTTANASMLVR